MIGTYRKRNPYFMALFVIILAIGGYLRVKDFSHDIDGPHVLRQSHVASNIEHFLACGILCVPDTYAKSLQYKMYDFPLYQHMVTILCSFFSTEVVQTGRAVNIILYGLLYIVLYQLMNHWQLSRQFIATVLLLYTFSPLHIFFSRAIIPDNLAISLAFLSFLCFLKWQTPTRPSSKLMYACMVMTGMLATLIKNPTYLPFVIAIILWFIVQHQWRRLFSKEMLLFGALIFGTVIAFKLFSNYVNSGSFRTPAWDYAWYFSTLSQRMQSLTYTRIIHRFFRELVSPPVFILALLGLFQYVFDKRGSGEKIAMLGLLGGSGVTILLFLNVNSLHNYYQLPYVFLPCFFAGYFIDNFFIQLKKHMKGYRILRTTLALTALMSIFWIFTLHITRFYMLPRTEPRIPMTQALFIQAHTAPNAFILYTVPDGNTNDPSFLYFAKRFGYNISPSSLSVLRIQELVQKYAPAYEEIYLYLPKVQLTDKNKELFESYKSQFKLHHSASEGDIFKL